jgi:hypothetical protein
MGYDLFLVSMNDGPRLAYVEVLPDDRRGSAIGFLVRALHQG